MIWLVGSSIVTHAFLEARRRPGGPNLTLNKRLGMSLWWQGKGGLTLRKLKGRIRFLMTLEELPQFIVIHIGGNDIGYISVGHLNYLLRRFMFWLSEQMPQTTLIFSQILPRNTWLYSNKNECMEKCRRRINSTMGRFMTKNGGCYIKYPDIKPTKHFIKRDGVHLTTLGNNVFLNTLQGALEQFVSCSSGGLTYPDTY